MKRKIISLFILAFCLCFTGCREEGKDSAPTPVPTAAHTVQPSSTPCPTPTPQPLPQGRVLTEKELENANIEINKDSVFNAVLCSMTVETPTQKTGIDRTLFIRLAELDEFNDNKLTVYNEYELKTLKEEGLNLNYDDIETDAVDYYRIPYTVVEQRIEKYLGVSYEGSVYQYNTEKCNYSHKYNCFYVKPDDIHYPVTYKFVYGIETQTQVYLYSAASELVLEKRRGGYIIKAYRRHNCRLPVMPFVQQENKDYVYMPKKVFLYADNTKPTEYNRAVKLYNDFLVENFSDYYGFVTEGSSAGTHYGLLDMTKDGIPELITKKKGAFTSYVVYGIVNGRVQQVGAHGISGDGGSAMLSNGMAVYRYSGVNQLGYFFETYDKDYVRYSNNFEIMYNYETKENNYYLNGKQVSRNEYIINTRYLLELYNDLNWFPKFDTGMETEKSELINLSTNLLKRENNADYRLWFYNRFVFNHIYGGMLKQKDYRENYYFAAKDVNGDKGPELLIKQQADGKEKISVYYWKNGDEIEIIPLEDISTENLQIEWSRPIFE